MTEESESFRISVDPGIDGGYAIWYAADRDPHRPPLSIGLFKRVRTMSFFDNSEMPMVVLEDVFRTYQFIDEMWCEYPSLMESDKGAVTASSGALVKLAFTVGRLAEFARERGCKFCPVEVNDWKGQMPKSAVEYRIKKRLGEAACRGFQSHIWDAVGIGLYAKGAF